MSEEPAREPRRRNSRGKRKRAKRKDRRLKGIWVPLPKRPFRWTGFLERHKYNLIYPGLLLPFFILFGMTFAWNYVSSREAGGEIARGNERRAAEMLQGITYRWYDSADIAAGSPMNPPERHPIPRAFLEEVRKKIGFPARAIIYLT